MIKIGVTGGSGFLGSLLSKKLNDAGMYDVKIIDVVGDPLFDPTILKEFVTGAEVIYHLAGIKDSKNPDLVRVNVQGTKNLLEVIRKIAPKCHFVFASSFAVYKIPKFGQIVSENFPTEPRNEYGKSKLEAEWMVAEYSNKFSIKSTILRMSNVYGPGDSFGRNSVVSDFINKIKNNETVTIEGDGDQTRDFIFIDDVVNALIVARKQQDIFNIFNISSGEEVSIRDLVSTIEKISGHKANIKMVSSDDQVGFWKGSSDRANKLLSWNSKISLQDGVGSMVNLKK